MLRISLLLVALCGPQLTYAGAGTARMLREPHAVDRFEDDTTIGDADVGYLSDRSVKPPSVDARPTEQPTRYPPPPPAERNPTEQPTRNPPPSIAPTLIPTLIPTLVPTSIISTGSCAGMCGSSGSDGCYCDATCTEAGDCCSDYMQQCPANTPTLAPTKAPTIRKLCGTRRELLCLQARDIILSSYPGAVKAFEAWNTDGNNYLSRREFNLGMAAAGSTLVTKQRQNLWKKIKPVSLNKLKKFMREEWPTPAPTPPTPNPTSQPTGGPRGPAPRPTEQPTGAPRDQDPRGDQRGVRGGGGDSPGRGQ
jgi:hypothetical protein